jgi:hypothetical protein
MLSSMAARRLVGQVAGLDTEHVDVDGVTARAIALGLRYAFSAHGHGRDRTAGLPSKPDPGQR